MQLNNSSWLFSIIHHSQSKTNCLAPYVDSWISCPWDTKCTLFFLNSLDVHHCSSRLNFYCLIYIFNSIQARRWWKLWSLEYFFLNPCQNIYPKSSFFFNPQKSAFENRDSHADIFHHGILLSSFWENYFHQFRNIRIRNRFFIHSNFWYPVWLLVCLQTWYRIAWCWLSTMTPVFSSLWDSRWRLDANWRSHFSPWTYNIATYVSKVVRRILLRNSYHNLNYRHLALFTKKDRLLKPTFSFGCSDGEA